MDPHDVVEEGSSDRFSGVGVDLCDEVSHLGEAVNDGEDDRFPTDTRKALHKVHGNVTPYISLLGQRI
jgi:hypothetical protein